MKSVVIGLVLGLLATILTLVISHESSPFYGYFLVNESLADVWRLINFPVMIVLMMTRIDFRPFALLLIFVQWFAIGSIVSSIVRTVRAKRMA